MGCYNGSMDITPPDLGSGSMAKAQQGACGPLRWAQGRPEGPEASLLREGPPVDRQEVIEYLRLLDRGSKRAARPEGACDAYVEGCREEYELMKRRGDFRWTVFRRIVDVVALLGGIAAIATLVLTLCSLWR